MALSHQEAAYVQTLIEFVLHKTRRTTGAGPAEPPTSAEARQAAMLLADQASKTGSVAIFGEFVGQNWPLRPFLRCGSVPERRRRKSKAS